MVILIGGVSCTGKTAMAQKLLERYQIPYLSIDHLKMGLIRGSRYCDFKATDSDDALTIKLWPIVKGIVMTAIENKQHLIIEGCYIPPDCLESFEPEYSKEMIALFIGFSTAYLNQHFDTGVIAHLSVIEQKQLDTYINPENFINLHATLKENCRMHHATYFEIDRQYEDEIADVYRWIDYAIEARQLL